MDKQIIHKAIQDSFDSLYNSEMISEKVEVTDDTVIIGRASVLDSIAFITLFSELEDRLSEASGKEIFLVLGDIHEFNSDKSSLGVNVLTDYILTII